MMPWLINGPARLFYIEVIFDSLCLLLGAVDRVCCIYAQGAITMFLGLLTMCVLLLPNSGKVFRNLIVFLVTLGGFSQIS